MKIGIIMEWWITLQNNRLLGVIVTLIVGLIGSIPALIISIVNYKRTSEYYNLASRPYLMLQEIFNSEGKIGLKVTAIQAPLYLYDIKVSYSTIASDNTIQSQPFEVIKYVQHVIYPNSVRNIRTNYDYPAKSERKEIMLVISYKALGGGNRYYIAETRSYHNEKWGIFAIEAN